jgi:hypothetical protein
MAILDQTPQHTTHLKEAHKSRTRRLANDLITKVDHRFILAGAHVCFACLYLLTPTTSFPHQDTW